MSRRKAVTTMQAPANIRLTLALFVTLLALLSVALTSPARI